MMTKRSPVADADWLFQKIVEEFSVMMDETERLRFYGRIAQLATERVDEYKAVAASAPERAGWLH